MLAALPHMGLSKGCSGHGSWFPPEGIIQQRETKLIAAVSFDDLLSEVAYCLFCFILLLRNKIDHTKFQQHYMKKRGKILQGKFSGYLVLTDMQTFPCAKLGNAVYGIGFLSEFPLTGTVCPYLPPLVPPIWHSAGSFVPESQTPLHLTEFLVLSAGVLPAGHCPHCSGAPSAPS